MGAPPKRADGPRKKAIGTLRKVSGGPPTDPRLFEALCALRDASSRFAPELGWAWHIVHVWLRIHVQGGPAPDDLRQLIVLRLYRSAGTMNATTPKEAKAWLGRIARNLLRDQHGAQKRRRDWGGMRVIKGGDGEAAIHLVDLLPAVESDRTPEDEERLAQWRDELMDRVDAWLEEKVARITKRAGDRLRAETAWLANIEGLDAREIADKLADAAPATATLYKWIERGREEVLIPVLGEWLRALEDEDGDERDDEEAEVELGAVRKARELLIRCRRADAGKARPERAKTHEEALLVSPVGGDTSVQGFDRASGPAEGGKRHA